MRAAWQPTAAAQAPAGGTGTAGAPSPPPLLASGANCAAATATAAALARLQVHRVPRLPRHTFISADALASRHFELTLPCPPDACRAVPTLPSHRASMGVAPSLSLTLHPSCIPLTGSHTRGGLQEPVLSTPAPYLIQHVPHTTRPCACFLACHCHCEHHYTLCQPPLSLQNTCLPPLTTDSPVSTARVSPSSPRFARCPDIATGSLTARLASLPSTADAY